jgi:hypothetical protein
MWVESIDLSSLDSMEYGRVFENKFSEKYREGIFESCSG